MGGMSDLSVRIREAAERLAVEVTADCCDGLVTEILTDAVYRVVVNTLDRALFESSRNPYQPAPDPREDKKCG